MVTAGSCRIAGNRKPGPNCLKVWPGSVPVLLEENGGARGTKVLGGGPERLWNPHPWRFSRLRGAKPWATWSEFSVDPTLSRSLGWRSPEVPLDSNCMTEYGLGTATLLSPFGESTFYFWQRRTKNFFHYWNCTLLGETCPCWRVLSLGCRWVRAHQTTSPQTCRSAW